ncbi:MAG TPA: hypothetical protein DCL80_02050 [Balneola sp.]|nr:hypothetical protein [Balneola sp.]
MNKDEQRMIYGYDAFHHEKYCCSVDYFIDNYKDFAKDDLTFRLFHSEQERDEYAMQSLFDEADIDVHERFKALKNINLDKA